MVNIAICGLGNIGKVHLSNLRSLRGCAITGIFDARREVSGPLAEANGVSEYSNLDAMFADDRADAIVVATPSSSHRELTVRALDSGRHVFVEKPLAGTLADAEAIVNAAAASDRLVQVGFCERFNAQYIEARSAVQVGSLGRVRAIYSSRIAPLQLCDPTWELGALDTAVHNLDLILWLMGRAPHAVQSRGVQVYPSPAIPHSVVTSLRFPDGALATDHITWLDDRAHPLHECARSRMLILGDKGSFEVDLSARPSALLQASSYRMRDTVILGGPEYYGCLKLQFESFFRSIEEGVPVLAPPADALFVEKVALAARDSLMRNEEIAIA